MMYEQYHNEDSFELPFFAFRFRLRLSFAYKIIEKINATENLHIYQELWGSSLTPLLLVGWALLSSSSSSTLGLMVLHGQWMRISVTLLLREMPISQETRRQREQLLIPTDTKFCHHLLLPCSRQGPFLMKQTRYVL